MFKDDISVLVVGKTDKNLHFWLQLTLCASATSGKNEVCPAHTTVNVCCSAAQRKLWNLPTKVSPIGCPLVQLRNENYGICQQKQLKLTVWNLRTKVTPTAERNLLEFVNKSNSNSLYFIQPRSEKFWNLPTKATLIDCILFSSAVENFGICRKATPIDRIRSEKFGICQQ
jgi:hypothetical protein